MKTSDKILLYIKENGPTRAKEVTEFLGISPQATHRQLKKLCTDERLHKRGTPPIVFYEIAPKQQPINYPEIEQTTNRFIDQQYFRISPDGRIMSGVVGFKDWVNSIGQVSAYRALAHAYVNTREESLEKLNQGYVVATQKIVDTFEKCCLDELIYQDFWSIPQFGKTKLGHLVTMGKSGQQREAIKELAESGRPLLCAYINKHRIQAIAFAPHSIPRKLVFLKTYEKFLDLGMPTISFVKATVDGLPIAQKSLTKLSERIENARNTIFPANGTVKFKRILIIDDALGSGATMNEMACKLNWKNPKTVYGFAIVGSMKGFEIISDV